MVVWSLRVWWDGEAGALVVVQERGCVGAALGASAWFTSETEVTVVCRSRLGVGGGVGGLAVLVWLESEVRPSECGSAAMPVCFGVGVGVGGFAVRWVGRCRAIGDRLL